MNEWSEEKQLLQLAGHLRGQALQEWNLMDSEQQQTSNVAVTTLKETVDPGSKVLAAQDFRHTTQRSRAMTSGRLYSEIGMYLSTHILSWKHEC